MKELSILGSTGSIGVQALSICRDHPHQFRIRALACGGADLKSFAEQLVAFDVPFGAIARGSVEDLDAAIRTEETRRSKPHMERQLRSGHEGVIEAAIQAPTGTVLNGITGGIGLDPSLAALTAGATLALANKESLIVGGHLIKQACQRPAQIIPVDSEHSAIQQALAAGNHRRGLTVGTVDGTTDVRRLILTASGGPFRGRTRKELDRVTADQALKHPTWSMGPVVTINSSTLINKALELIEAQILFDMPASSIEVTVHPQSIVHSLVEFIDGSTLAQASPPDMRLPIALGLTLPQRLDRVASPCNWDEATQWTFEPVDEQTFPAISLARQAVSSTPTHPAVLNAANEVCVEAFLHERIRYLQIVDTVAQVLSEHVGLDNPTRDDISMVTQWATIRTEEIIAA
ncbi:MAG: 1-deoxy-D-xylulose-5-phosphate reductoisomerase [Actinomycetaceae bacterium]|nr:1-deoxy-D-xylulose-5-phosphate reductoisomerase [Actinomycetaceae bacterium]